MKTIMKAFSTLAEQPDVFACWQEELQLRRRLRRSDAWQEVKIGTRTEYEFLQRSLFYGPQRDIFFAILINNLADQSVLSLLRDSDPGVVTGFMDYLANYIEKQHPPAASLGFLIHLYQDGYQPRYMRLIKVMDAQQCTYLMARTGNRDLRRMLKEHLERIKDGKSGGIADQSARGRISQPWPTIHGDKIELLAEAAKVLKRKQDSQPNNDNSDSRWDNLAEGAELLWQAGLLTDCIALLNRMIQDRDLEETFANAAGTPPLHRQVSRLLDRTLPLLGILAAPLHPRGWVLDNYRSLFPGFSPEPGSLLHLDLYAIVAAALQGRRQYAKYEIIQKAVQLQLLREDDPLAAALVQWDRTGVLDSTPTIIEGLAAKMKSQPHEAFTGLELLRYVHIQESKALDRPYATRMLEMYLQLFNWLPHAVFMNDPLVRQLGPLSDEDLRDEALKILAARQHDRDYEAAGIPSSGATDKIEPVLKKKLRLSRDMGVF